MIMLKRKKGNGKCLSILIVFTLALSLPNLCRANIDSSYEQPDMVNSSDETAQKINSKTEIKIGVGFNLDEWLYLNATVNYMMNDIVFGINYRGGGPLEWEWRFCKVHPQTSIKQYFISIGSRYIQKKINGLYFSYAVGFGFIDATFRGAHLYNSGSNGIFAKDCYYQRINIQSICLPIRGEIGGIYRVFGITTSFESTISDLKPIHNLYLNFCWIW